MPKTTKAKKKISKTKAKTVTKPKTVSKSKTISKPKTKTLSKPQEVVKGPIKISKTYIPKDTEKYMCEKHKVFLELNFKNGRRN